MKKEVKKEVKKQQNSCSVSCMNCMHALLHRYDNNPILSACQCQPQLYNERFPFKVEVASVVRHCADWRESPVKKYVEQRVRRTV